MLLNAALNYIYISFCKIRQHRYLRLYFKRSTSSSIVYELYLICLYLVYSEKLHPLAHNAWLCSSHPTTLNRMKQTQLQSVLICVFMPLHISRSSLGDWCSLKFQPCMHAQSALSNCAAQGRLCLTACLNI